MPEDADPAPEQADLTPEEFVEAIRAGDLVEAMRAGYATFSREAVVDTTIFQPDAEWHQRPQLPDARVHRGHEEIARMNDEFIESFEGFRAQPLEIFETGGRVVAVVLVSGRVKGSDQRVQMEEVHVWSFRDGLVSEVHEYLTKGEALEAVAPVE
jgi:ketosteroid isomerase-like protein